MQQKFIHSAQNAQYKTWQALLGARGAGRHGLALASGRKIVPELLATRGGAGATLLVREGAEALLREVAAPAPDVSIVFLARGLFDELDTFGTGMPLLVLPQPPVHSYAARAPKGLVLGVAAQDPANLGAILRSALAFEVAEVVLLEECAHPFLPRVTRAASGANFRLKLAQGPSIRALQESWLALDMQGTSVERFDWPRDCRLLLGEEGLGVPESVQGERLAIAISPRMESLNVAVSAGIALAAYRRTHPIGS